jgi:hypothetical protein
MRNESLSQGRNGGRDDSVWMSDITYAAVEIVHFMNPKIRTRHQDPRNTLSRTPFISGKPKSKYCTYKGVECKECRYIALVFFQPAVLLEGRGEAGGAEVGSKRLGVNDHATAQIRGINKRLVSMLDNGGIRQRRGYGWSIVRLDHFNSATLFAVAPH